MFEEFAGHVLVRGIEARQLQRYVQHHHAKERHPRCTVSLSIIYKTLKTSGEDLDDVLLIETISHRKLATLGLRIALS